MTRSRMVEDESPVRRGVQRWVPWGALPLRLVLHGRAAMMKVTEAVGVLLFVVAAVMAVEAEEEEGGVEGLM